MIHQGVLLAPSTNPSTTLKKSNESGRARGAGRGAARGAGRGAGRRKDPPDSLWDQAAGEANSPRFPGTDKATAAPAGQQGRN